MDKNAPKPETPEEQMAVYLNIAKTLGYKITPEELSQAVGERKQEVKAKVSGIYVLSARYIRGPKIEGGKEAKKQKKMDKLLDKLR